MWELKGLGRNRIFEILRPGKEPQSPRGRRVQLPLRFLTSFIGRERELNGLMDDVKAHRLVTLKGTGGIGKTRLADQIARRLSDLFSDGVFFVPLTDISNSPQAVVSELITCLGVKTAGFPSEEAALIHEMKGRTALLVLDNFEAVHSASPILHKLLLECPELHLVITSQIALGLNSEQVRDVSVMSLPATNTDAAQLTELDAFKLFRERARAKKANWEVGDPDVANVARILESTEGLPLAIELAAARVGDFALATSPADSRKAG